MATWAQKQQASERAERARRAQQARRMWGDESDLAEMRLESQCRGFADAYEYTDRSYSVDRTPTHPRDD